MQDGVKTYFMPFLIATSRAFLKSEPCEKKLFAKAVLHIMNKMAS